MTKVFLRRWLAPGALLVPLLAGCGDDAANSMNPDAAVEVDVATEQDAPTESDVPIVKDAVTPRDVVTPEDVATAPDARPKDDVAVVSDVATAVDAVEPADVANPEDAPRPDDVVGPTDVSVVTDAGGASDATAVMDADSRPDAMTGGDVPVSRDAPAVTDGPRPDGAGGITNDTRANATVIDLTEAAQVIAASNVGARNDAQAPLACVSRCGPSSMHRDVFFTFTLRAPEIVYADTFGASIDTVLYLQDVRGVNIPAANGATTCDDDSCNTRQSQVVARLEAGTYYLVAFGCNGQGGSFPIRFQHLAVGSSAVQRVNSEAGGNQAITGTLADRPSSVAAGPGPEDLAYFTTCPGFTARRLGASTCDTNTQFDSVLAYRRPGAMPTMADTNNDACNLLSSLTTQVPAGAGLHALFIDSNTARSLGAWTVNLRFGACPAGTVDCRMACRSLQHDPADCGACGRACGGGERCAAGRCVAAPANDACDAAAALTLNAAGTSTVVTGSTVGATHSPGAFHCSRVGRDLYWRFTLTQRELVYADTFGSEGDTQVGFLSSCTGEGNACVDDACNGAQAQTYAVLEAGTHTVVVTTFAANANGAVRLSVQHRPISGPLAGTIPRGAFTLDGMTPGAATRVQACPASPSTTPSPERVYAWMTCPGNAGLLTADSCEAVTNYDTLLQYQSTAGAAGLGACNDDQGTATCRGAPNRAALRTAVVPGPGAHFVSVSGSNGAAGSYRVSGTRP